MEVLFGTGLGDLRQRAEDTVIVHRSVDLSEYSLDAFAQSLHAVLASMAGTAADFALAPAGTAFYFLLIVRPPTLGLEVPKSVLIPFTRMQISAYEQLEAPARRIAEQLADLGTPAWIDPSQARVAAHLD
jgi:hypothetical protein